MHDSGIGKYLENASGELLSDPTGFGKYLPGDEATEPQTANQSVFSDSYGSLAHYLGDG